MKDNFNYYYDEEKNIIYITRDLLEKSRELEMNIEGNPKLIDNSNCYSINYRDLKKLEDKLNLEGNEIKITTKERPTNILIVYKLGEELYTTKKISDTNITKKILNKICYKTNLEELNNEKYVIVKVYHSHKEDSKPITICNYNNILFIPENFINENNLNIENKRRIKVNDEIYIEIENNELEQMRNNFNIQFIIKEIIPANK